VGRLEADMRELIRGWVTAACREWSYPNVSEPYFDAVYERLPVGVRTLVASGHRDGLIKPVGGYRFTLQGLPPGKGPYAWVSRNEQAQAPAINWEYLIQAAEYARVYGTLSPKGYLIAVEDRLMDITVSDLDGALRWYIEVKERAIDIPGLVDRIGTYGHEGVDLNAPDRGNDALRKAKYLIQYRPVYLSISAIGLRRDFQVAYSAGNRFALIDDMVPLI
jgi:hypothetical protein